MTLTVGDKIKKFRIEKGMTQEELGKELGVGKATIQKYESNQIQNLKSAHIKKLCRLFNRIPWEFIFEGESGLQTYKLDHLETLKNLFGDDSMELFVPLNKLNENGFRKVRDYVKDLAKIEEYQKEETEWTI